MIRGRVCQQRNGLDIAELVWLRRVLGSMERVWWMRGSEHTDDGLEVIPIVVDEFLVGLREHLSVCLGEVEGGSIVCGHSALLCLLTGGHAVCKD